MILMSLCTRLKFKVRKKFGLLVVARSRWVLKAKAVHKSNGHFLIAKRPEFTTRNYVHSTTFS